MKDNIYKGILYIPAKYKFRYVSGNLVVGQYSDDTEMTMTNVRSIIENNGEYDRNKIILAYEEWANTARFIGNNTKSLFKKVKTIKGYQNRWNKKFYNTDTNTWTQSNGSLMRCSMLSYLWNFNIVGLDCKLTNPHTINIDPKFAYTYAIQSASFNINKNIVINTLLESNLNDI